MTEDRYPNRRMAYPRTVHAWAAGVACVLLLVACATPDLKPFAEASKTLSASVTSGGTLAINPIARAPYWDGKTFLQPGEAGHPDKQLQDSWALRRKTMDAVLVYSASLAAIGDAAAHRGENATAVVKAVSDLASAVPGVQVFSKGAGDLAIFALTSWVEVKAFHDMRQAVAAADPAVQLIARVLKKDFEELGTLHASFQRNVLIQRTAALRPIEILHGTLVEQRKAQRQKLEKNVSDKDVGAEITRLDGLMTGVEGELTKLRTDRAAAQELLQSGQDFFAAAGKAVDAWASVHADLALALEQNRTPNLVLLAARADELKALLENLKK